MYTITGRITGLAPLLFSRPYKVIDGGGTGKPGDKEREEEPTKRLHIDPEKGVYIPRNSFKNCLLDGVKISRVKEGNRSAYGIVEATVFPKDHLYLGKQTFDRVFETPACVPPRTGSMVLIRYPWFDPGWSATFSLMVAVDRKDIVEFVEKGLDSASLLAGIGSWRPEYGRFALSEWDVSQN